MAFSLVKLFIIFFSCFLSLLLVGAVVWKIKQRYDNYRRRQRAYVEMEQMASRPFAMVCPDLSPAHVNDPIPCNPVISTNKHTSRPKSTYLCPSPIALEPCADSKAAVLSLLVILPQGDEDMTPPGTSGLLIGSTLVNLGANRKTVESAKLHREGWSSRKGGAHAALKDAANAACRNTHNPPPPPQPPPPHMDDVIWGI